MTETPTSFTCDNCGKTFRKIWSDEEAAAEAQENFPGIDVTDPDETGTVCEDCFQQIRRRPPTLLCELDPVCLMCSHAPDHHYVDHARRAYGCRVCPDGLCRRAADLPVFLSYT